MSILPLVTLPRRQIVSSATTDQAGDPRIVPGDQETTQIHLHRTLQEIRGVAGIPKFPLNCVYEHSY